MALQATIKTLICMLFVFVTACDLPGTQIKATVDAQSDLKVGRQHWDLELIEHALKTMLVENEGMLELVPDHEPLLLTTIDSYTSYAGGFLRDKMDVAEMEGRFDDFEKLEKRAGLMFDRSVMHLKHLLRLRDEGFDKALSGGLQTFTFWVEENFFEKDDAELLLITGTGWITTMIASEAGLAAAVDRPFAEALIKRSVELDPELKGGNGLGLLGMVECAMPVAYGGRPNKGMQILERAAKVSNRQAHLVLINIAEYCAVALQDRKLFRKVLMEIIESGDVEKYRLENKLARRKAERLLSQIDDLFFEDA